MARPLGFTPLDDATLARVAEAVDACADQAFEFLERLVEAPSTVGEEVVAQSLVAEELSRLGLRVTEIDVPESIASDPDAGVPQTTYEGRANILATTSSDELELLINGHIDVVPADPRGWASSPWSPRLEGGWMFGRGAGDMKGGLAMATLALDALRSTLPSALERPLGVLSVIEEECTGNGTLSALRQGVSADLVLVTEPTDLELLIGGTGIVWVDVTIQGAGGHAEVADRVEHPLDVGLRLVAELEEMGRRVAREHHDAAFDAFAEPYNVNVGLVRAGDWRSSVASVVTLGVRFGHPRAWTTDEAIDVIVSVITKAIPDDINVSFSTEGFRAQGYLLDPASPLVDMVQAAHVATHGSTPPTRVGGSTTDARFYINQADVPALCYGPVARHIHGVDESVNLASIVAGAKTLAHFVAGLGTTTDAS
ncbi:MAG TPA: M20/M25/M40 family metallo-hydrolase [Acidimicrobiales bacterium]|nr:M20/M25/M40 family metallo-hydrolase [Acidimicrobiales bacterium]